MALSPNATFIPLVGLNNFCTVVDDGGETPETRYALTAGNGFIGLNTEGDGNVPSDIVANPMGRVGSLQTVFLLILDGYNSGEGTGTLQFAINNPPGTSLGLQRPSQTVDEAASYDPSLFYPKCTAQLARTNYLSKDSGVLPFEPGENYASFGVFEEGAYTIGAVRSINQIMAQNNANLTGVGQNGCCIISLLVPSGTVEGPIQISIDFQATAGN